jgi:hypothetical protein
VLETRDTRRRRECANRHRFTTAEIEVKDTMRGLCTDCKHWDRTGPDAVRAEVRSPHARLSYALCTNPESPMHRNLPHSFDSCTKFDAQPMEPAPCD